MAFNLSNIEWTRFSLGLWEGCDKVSQGCKYCYAEREVKGRWGNKFLGNVRRTGESTWKAPERIHKQLTGAEPFTERLVFICHKSDFFHEAADPWRAEAWAIIKKTPKLIYQILTKRDYNIESRLPDDWGPNGYPNVWLGVSVEDEKNVHRIETLASIPAAVRFISFEPLIEKVELADIDGHTLLKIHWAILGGESGNEKPPYIYRPCELDWLRLLKAQMEMNGIPVFVKQLGTHLAKKVLKLKDRHGRDMSEFPADLQVRQWPQDGGIFTCFGCGHDLPATYNMRTPRYCYMCDPNLTVDELLEQHESQLGSKLKPENEENPLLMPSEDYWTQEANS